MNNHEYWKEVRSIADNMAAEALADNDNDIDAALDDINDCRLHETIDGHQWVIYYSYNLEVLQHSDNAEYMADNIGGLDDIVRERSVNDLFTAMAYWALYADVQERIDDALQDTHDKLIDGLIEINE